MPLIDTHAHLYLQQFEEDREEVLQRAFAAGVQKIYLPNVDSDTISDMLKLEADYPGRCFAMMGLHPCSVKDNYREELAIVKEWLQSRPFAAVGEIGIDLYWDKTHIDEQRKAFERQMEWSIEFDLPIVIHSRESTDMIIEIIDGFSKKSDLRGIFHCFTGDEDQARAIVDLGFYLGIGGVLTFKNAGLDETVRQVSLEYLVLETDAPYLAPAPHRGKRNESAYVLDVARKLASVKEVSLEEVIEKTGRNAERIFTSREAVRQGKEREKTGEH
ncbi:MAG: TatD family hydrolase [Saprospiraceae bacterium]|nr:TatD family hydrolase [Saprospiraceae bacterium]